MLRSWKLRAEGWRQATWHRSASANLRVQGGDIEIWKIQLEYEAELEFELRIEWTENTNANLLSNTCNCRSQYSEGSCAQLKALRTGGARRLPLREFRFWCFNILEFEAQGALLFPRHVNKSRLALAYATPSSFELRRFGALIWDWDKILLEVEVDWLHWNLWGPR